MEQVRWLVREDEFLELRVGGYPSGARLYRVNGLNRLCNLNRVEVGNYLPYRREHLGDGSAVQVFGLPLCDATYELWQTLDGKRVQRFFAVVNGTLQRMYRDSIEKIVEGALTLKDWASSIAREEVK